MAVRRFVCLALMLGAALCAQGQPTNDIDLADSAWPIYHANTRATASSSTLGPGTAESAQTVRSLTKRRWRKPLVSPWTVMAAPYPDGTQAVFTTPNDGIAKYAIIDGQLEAVDFLPLDRKFFDFDWGILLLNNGWGVATEQKRDRFVLFGDVHSGPRSPIEIKGEIVVDRARHGSLSAHFSVTPDGHLITLTGANKLLAIDIAARQIVATMDLPAQSGTPFHNSFPIDERGRLYLSTQQQMTAVDWTGSEFRLAWSAAYDMRGPGCEDVPEDRRPRDEFIAVARGKTCTGSGTTPTIIGDTESGIVVIVDGHAPKNHLVAFWRDEPPADWTALPDPNRPGETLDRRVAGVFPLPLSSPEGAGFTAENSPAALGNATIVAQWAGFKPKRQSPRGVQRVDWLPGARRFELIWANPDVHFNGVPTIACARPENCQAYGMGRYGSRYAYTSLSFDTGVETGRIDLGRSDQVLDQGNNHAVAADGSIVYSGRHVMVRIE